MGTLADSKAAYYKQYGYTGSINDMEYQYYSVPPTLDSLGYVRTICPGATTVTTFSVANTTWCYRVSEGGMASALRIFVNLQSGNIALALYKNTGSGLNALPGTRYATTGSIACPAAGAAFDVPLGGSYSVTAGDWIGFGCDNITAKFSAAVGVGDAIMNAGLSGMDGNFPPAANATTMQYANNRLFTIVGVP